MAEEMELSGLLSGDHVCCGVEGRPDPASRSEAQSRIGIEELGMGRFWYANEWAVR